MALIDHSSWYWVWGFYFELFAWCVFVGIRVKFGCLGVFMSFGVLLLLIVLWGLVFQAWFVELSLGCVFGLIVIGSCSLI